MIIVSTVFLSRSVDHGFGGNLTKLPKYDSEMVLKDIAIQVPLVTFSTTIARSGFIIYLLAVLGTNKAYVIVLWVLLVIQAAGNIVSAVLPLSICRDVRALWDIEAAIHTTCGDTAAVIKFAYYSNSTFLERVSVDDFKTNFSSFQLGHRFLPGSLPDCGVLESQPQTAHQGRPDRSLECGLPVRFDSLHRSSTHTN